MAFDAMPYHFFEIKMKENKNINKNIHHNKGGYNKRKKGGINE